MVVSEYRSPLRPIPRHTIPPEFPLSTAGVLELNETLRSEEMDAQDPIECEWEDDEAWWGEVISSLADIEWTSQRSMSSNQVNTQAG